jgi:adenylate cyclase
VGGRGPLTGRPPPKEISDALNTDRSAIAAHYESASVLFADVVGFTPMAAAMIPLRLVNLLNEVFSSFDDLVEKDGLENIKTIGDCYIVAAGVPRERADHALALVQLALDMRRSRRAPDIRRRDACVSHRRPFPDRWSPA